MAAPFVMTRTSSIFAAKGTSYYFPGAPFFLACVLVLLSIAIFVFVSRGEPESGFDFERGSASAD